MKELIKEINVSDAELRQALKWLSENKNGMLELEGVDAVLRYLLKELPKTERANNETLLDECAMRAMQSIVTGSTPMELQDKHHRYGLAITSYEIAHAMLRARKEVQS